MATLLQDDEPDAPVFRHYTQRELDRQSGDFSAALTRAGCPLECMLLPGVDHFELIDTLGDAGSALSRFLISHLKRPPAAPPRHP